MRVTGEPASGAELKLKFQFSDADAALIVECDFNTAFHVASKSPASSGASLQFFG
ncbi:hypothetical protein [Thiomonas sp. X19]|uniref:hypothetical protein n=1 Tax=Thiomonas sp. X19 TaxID=1050370 RepID=UPI001313E745|nr:hypothetical protein [Thiomonas sp. X19]